MKVLMICNTSQTIYNFRLPLIRKLKQEGLDVYTVSFDCAYNDLLSKEGIDNIYVKNNNRSINPFKVLSLQKRLQSIIKTINPEIVFTFMVKPNIFGTLAAHKAGVKNIYSMVEGAGDPFIYQTIKWKLIKKIVCHLYKKAFKYSKKVFFLNEDDKKEFVELGLVEETKGIVINGIGVDLDKFCFKKVNLHSNTFVMVARMLESKGVIEYCKCAELVRKTCKDAKFIYLGAEGTVKIKDIQSYIDNGDIDYLGLVTDVRPFIEDSLLLLLPSHYREGKPMSVMEAQSIGRGVITCNSIGCRDIVVDGYNGYIVEQKDYKKMAELCIQILQNKKLACEIGTNARKYAELNFNQDQINKQILDYILN